MSQRRVVLRRYIRLQRLRRRQGIVNSKKLRVRFRRRQRGSNPGHGLSLQLRRERRRQKFIFRTMAWWYRLVRRLLLLLLLTLKMLQLLPHPLLLQRLRSKWVVQQQQAPATIPSSLDTVVLFSLVPLTTSTIPSPTAITTTSSTITTPTTTSSIQYSEPGNAGASFTSGQAVSTFSATVTINNTLIASAYKPTTFETVVKPTASAFATVAAAAQEEDNVYEG